MGVNMVKQQILFAVVAIVVLMVDAAMPEVMASAHQEAWVGALISLAGSVASGILANKQAKKQQALRAQQEQEWENWYQNEVNQSYLDRADNLSMLRRYREVLDETSRRNNTAAIKGGATDEARVALAAEQNKGLANIMSQMAANGERHRDRVKSKYMDVKSGFQNSKIAASQQNAENVINTITSASNVVGDLVGGINWGGAKKV